MVLVCNRKYCLLEIEHFPTKETWKACIGHCCQWKAKCTFYHPKEICFLSYYRKAFVFWKKLPTQKTYLHSLCPFTFYKIVNDI